MFVGIDVAKAELVIAIRPSGERWTATNDEAGIQQLLARLGEDAPALVVRGAARHVMSRVVGYAGMLFG